MATKRILKKLPKEISNKATLTAKEIKKALLTPAEVKKDVAYRDRMIAEFNSAARQSVEEEQMAHAQAAAGNYAREIERLTGLLALKRSPKGMPRKAELRRALKITADHLAEALLNQGLYDDAYTVVTRHAPKSHLVSFLARVAKAIERPDDEHCPCPATDKHEVRRVYVPSRRRFVPLISCACGHMNASEKPPADFAALQAAKAEAAGDGQAHDLTVVKRAERIASAS
ncbi:MAG: hypothetical protein WBV94_21695 [Blastocatellia bacterium]